MKLHKFIIFLLVFLSLSVSHAETEFEYKIPEFREFIVEYSFPYMISNYTSDKNIKLLTDRSEKNNRTPEDTLVSHFSAMSNKNYEWFLSDWTPADQEQSKIDDIKNNWNPAFWYRIWGENLEGKSIKLLTRIERGKYVYIGYRLYGTGSDNKDDIETLAFTKIGNLWLITNAAACDPILYNWKDTDQRIKRRGQIESNCTE